MDEGFLPDISSTAGEGELSAERPVANDVFIYAATNITESLANLVYLLREDHGDPQRVAFYTDMLNERVGALSQLIFTTKSSSRRTAGK